ncbi:MAG: hypothetical protein K2X86_18700 [Cytophagaceae bacterium]|nr:hypothetical protein [Cytophagaceae bacterium]
MIKNIILFFSFILAISITTISLAQPPDGGGMDEDPDTGIPIDGGVGLLAAAGIAYGGKKIYDLRKNRK